MGEHARNASRKKRASFGGKRTGSLYIETLWGAHDTDEKKKARIIDSEVRGRKRKGHKEHLREGWGDK